MTEQYSYSPDELERLARFRQSLAEFKELIASLPADTRSPDHNRQFNELRAEAQLLLKAPFVDDGVPLAAVGGSSATTGAVSMIVVLGVLLALVGFGINAVILEDVLINSLGCCVSSGGMLLVIGAFGVLVTKQFRPKITPAGEMNYLVDLLIYQVDHRLAMIGRQATDIPQTADFGRPPTSPEGAGFAPPPVSPAPPPPESDDFMPPAAPPETDY